MMKRIEIWRLVGGSKHEYESIMGYSFDEGILGSHKGLDGGWCVHHIPSGLLAGYMTFPLLRDAKSFARRILKIDAFDWYTTDPYDFGELGNSGLKWMQLVGHGKMTVEEFNTKMMIQKMEEKKC